MVIKKVLHMNAGDGENSYANNSGFQKIGIMRTKSIMDGVLEEMCKHHFQECFKIADLGCSSGPNTLSVISGIIETIQRLCDNKKQRIPEVQVFLNDVPENDFNNLFKLVTTFYDELQQQERSSMENRCFISVTPGSFYGRLFPSKSINFIHSSYSVHWLSQVPEGLESNKGNIYFSMTSPPHIFQAYLKQYQRDFTTFLTQRAEELMPGGGMVLTFICRDVTDPATRDDCFHITMLAKSLLDLVAEGLVKDEDVDSFNIPMYTPYKEEVKAVIQNEGSFKLNELEVFVVNWDGSASSSDKDYAFGNYEAAKTVASSLRAALEPTLASHFGSSIFDHLFARFTHHMAEKLCRQRSYFNMVLSLTRK